MATMLFTRLFLQAVLLWNVHCRPAQDVPGYSFSPFQARQAQAPAAVYAPQAGYAQAGYAPPGYAQAGYAPQAGYVDLPDSSEEVSWIMQPSTFSEGDDALSGGSAGYGSPQSSGFGSAFVPEFVPGELVEVEGTEEHGGYTSETQEQGLPPPPQFEAEVFPGQGFAAPMSIVPGHFYPFNWRFLTGQYPTGTYTHSSSSIEHGRDGWQENHYLGYDYPSAIPGKGQRVQSFPGVSDQRFQVVGKGW